MKLIRTGHHPHHVGHEGSHVMLPMVMLSLMAIGVYYGVRSLDMSEPGRDALFDVVMVLWRWALRGSSALSVRGCVRAAMRPKRAFALSGR
jgi:hypothetical protein